MHKCKIINEILNLTCPSCKAVFIDFDDCFALTCSRCSTGFCVWCLKDYFGDAHAHVAHCLDNKNGNGNVYGTLEDFNRHHNNRRLHLINERLKDCDDDVRKAVFKKLEPDLKELGINPNNVSDDGCRIY